MGPFHVLRAVIKVKHIPKIAEMEVSILHLTQLRFWVRMKIYFSRDWYAFTAVAFCFGY